MALDQNQQIIDYLRDKLNAEERTAFKEQLRTDEYLQKEVEALALIIKGVKKSGKDQLKSRLQKIHATQTQMTPVAKTRRLWPRVASVAAAIALLIISGVFLFKSQNLSPEMAFENYYKPYELKLASRAATDNQLTLQINELYFNKKYNAALPLLEEALLADPNNARLLLASGICHLELDELTSARSKFSTIVKSKNLRLTDKANWYLALSFLKEGKILEAKSFLNPIIKNAEADQHHEAKELLKKLEQHL